jgi:hypothetical protein
MAIASPSASSRSHGVRHMSGGGCEPDPPNGDYARFLTRMRAHYARTAEGALFTTGARDLFELYIRELPEEQRRHHTCNACRRFFNRYMGLVSIDDQGNTSPVMVSKDETGWHGKALRVIWNRVRRAKVTGVFLTSETVWGEPFTGPWMHISIPAPGADRVFRARGVETAGQAMAELREDYRILESHLYDFDLETYEKALHLCEEGVVARSEKLKGMARWLVHLRERLTRARNQRCGDNLVWRAIATAPKGYAHFHDSVLGTILTDLREGKTIQTIKRKAAKKMDPLQYQRPRAAPSAGAINRAEKLFEELGCAASLRRRFARLDEIPLLWVPRGSRQKILAPGGLFGHLTPKGASSAARSATSSRTMTWEKFQRTVLPEATKIEYLVPHSGSFTGMTTAADPDSRPILQWDSVARRNPVSAYVYANGSAAQTWNLRPHSWAKVVGFTLVPSMWHDYEAFKHHGRGAIVLLDQMYDRKMARPGQGLALFPENFRSEFREVRSVIEAHSKTGTIEEAGRMDLACGTLLFEKVDGRTSWNCNFRVTRPSGVSEIMLDRWD